MIQNPRITSATTTILTHEFGLPVLKTEKTFFPLKEIPVFYFPAQRHETYRNLAQLPK